MSALLIKIGVVWITIVLLVFGAIWFANKPPEDSDEDTVTETDEEGHWI